MDGSDSSMIENKLGTAIPSCDVPKWSIAMNGKATRINKWEGISDKFWCVNANLPFVSVG